MRSKILIGCPTYAGKEYCHERFLEGLKNISYSPADLLFVDNSEGEEYFHKLKKIELPGRNITVLKDNITGPPISKIISSRNRVRDHFLSGDYEYLFFLDTDIVAPGNAIERLLLLDSAIASGAYLGRVTYQGQSHLIPVFFRYHNDGQIRTFALEEVLTGTVINVYVCGLGCCLIKKAVLEQVGFRKFGKTASGGEDVAFCLDAQNKGFTIKADTSVRCKHMGRNEVLVFPKSGSTNAETG